VLDPLGDCGLTNGDGSRVIVIDDDHLGAVRVERIAEPASDAIRAVASEAPQVGFENIGAQLSDPVSIGDEALA